MLGQALLADQRNAGHTAVFGHETRAKLKFLHGDVLEAPGFGEKLARDFAGRRSTRRTQNVAVLVRSFAAKDQLGGAVGRLTPGEQFLDTLRPFIHQDFHGLLVAQAVPGNQRVLEVEADLFFVAEFARDAVVASRILDFFFGEQ